MELGFSANQACTLVIVHSPPPAAVADLIYDLYYQDELVDSGVAGAIADLIYLDDKLNQEILAHREEIEKERRERL